ncbi:MAG TPA: TetR/AcrR family transcriptional regulator [Solirubrobacterales bacterium]|nr:TetR/AcrR family transcriptional regulator [Solirubrobacterales bacterium]
MEISATSPPLRERLLETARTRIEDFGPEALRARSLTAAVGTSTQSLYTLFGGMPGLIDAVVADGFDEFARYVEAIPETDDPVADFFARGWAYSDWALAHTQLYRLMFGLTGGELRRHAGLEVALAGAVANSPQAQRSLNVLVDSMRRVTESGRLAPTDPEIAAGQFLSGTHGYVLLQAGGVFGSGDDGRAVIGAFAVNLMVGLGDSRERASRSLEDAIARHG